MNDVVIDTNVARLFDAPADPKLKPLFGWLAKKGSLAVSQRLLVEYSRHGNQILAALIRDLDDSRRLNKIAAARIKAFTDDGHFAYKCNNADVWHARTVFLSVRKILVSFDGSLRDDVNAFKKIDGIKSRAFDYPPTSILE
jgi:hypothetical protein